MNSMRLLRARLSAMRCSRSSSVGLFMPAPFVAAVGGASIVLRMRAGAKFREAA